ncbi:MAG: RNA polymerase sigma factor [Candidatus Gastranaerophilaceae bacterium]|nr:sigma-70 family RNA polymerase sigma factor [Christensenellales bacterium]
MDGNHPNRKKDKLNPYILSRQAGRYFLSFKDGQGVQHEIELDESLYNLFDRFELEDISYFNEASRHYEPSELTEQTLHDRMFLPVETVEEMVLRSAENERLYRAISNLPEVQRRRLLLYYFGDLTYEQIAAEEGCTFQAIGKSIAAAEKNLKKFLTEG